MIIAQKRFVWLFAVGVSVSSIACRSGGRDDERSESKQPTDSASKSGVVILTAAQITHGNVAWEAAQAGAVTGEVAVSGQLAMNEDRGAAIAAPAQGRVIDVFVKPGERVARDAPLVSLQSAEAQTVAADVVKGRADVAAKRAAAAYAKAAKGRAERLLNLKAIPRQDYERAIADDELASTSLTQAEAELVRAQSVARQLSVDPRDGSMTIRSTSAGVVATRSAIPGAVVSPGAPLVTIVDPSSLWLLAALPEHSANDTRVGAMLRFTVAGFPDTLAARVRSVGAVFDSVTRTLPIRAEVANTTGRLRPAMLAKVWIRSGNLMSVVTATATSIQRIEGKPVIFVAQPDGKGGARFEKRDVELGATVGDRVSILRGASAGDLIVIRGALAVKAELLKGQMPKEMEE